MQNNEQNQRVWDNYLEDLRGAKAVEHPKDIQTRAEYVLVRHGVWTEAGELQRGPRSKEKIDALIRDVQAGRPSKSQ